MSMYKKAHKTQNLVKTQWLETQLVQPSVMLEESTKALVLESKRNSLDPREKDMSLQFLECGDPLSAFNEFELRKS